MQPVDLEQDGKHEGDGRVNQNRVHGSMESFGEL